MKIIRSKYKIPFYNFALEELLLKDEKLGDEDILLIYQNDKSIIVGKNQNTHEEINENFVKDNNIILSRRISGGGAVYQDMGNVNFCFITKKSEYSYSEFLSPIIKFLRTLGIDAKFSGKNDVIANGFKISGNAQYKFKNKMFHHGTLLFDSQMEMLSKALKPNPLKFQSKSVKSVRKRVSNIKDLMEQKISTEKFIDLLTEFFVEQGYQLTDQSIVDEDKIKELATAKSLKEWTFGKNPPFNFSSHKRFDGGTIKIKIDSENDLIKNIKFEGDYMSSNDFEDIYELFKDIAFETEKIQTIIYGIKNFEDYFGKISKEEIISLFIEARSKNNV